MTTEIENNFLFQQIRKYNRGRRQSYRDAALYAVGRHTGLIQEKRRSPLIELSPNERNRVLYFLRQFLEQQGLEVLLK